MRSSVHQGSKKRAPYKRPELVCFGTLSTITNSTSGGSLPDGGTMPNMNTTIMA